MTKAVTTVKECRDMAIQIVMEKRNVTPHAHTQDVLFLLAEEIKIRIALPEEYIVQSIDDHMCVVKDRNSEKVLVYRK